MSASRLGPADPPSSPNDLEGFKNDFRSFMGWYKLLEGVHETFDVVTLREISCGAANLDRYRYIVVPDFAYIQEDVISRMNEYVQRGGHLITAGRFAERSESGRLLPLPRRRLSGRPSRITERLTPATPAQYARRQYPPFVFVASRYIRDRRGMARGNRNAPQGPGSIECG